MRHEHVVETRYAVALRLPHRQTATVYSHCLCGWAGPRHVLQPQAAEVAHHAADSDGAEHIAQPQPPAQPSTPRPNTRRPS